MSSATATSDTQPKLTRKISGDQALDLAARVWFCTAVAGQLIFVFSVASFYGRAALGGNLLALNSSMTHGYIPTQPLGNVVVGVHLSMAVLITIAGALQLMPQVRARAPAFHRWNGRFYVFAAVTVSLAGLYMTWFRGTIGGLVQHLGISLDAVLIMLCAVMALRYAVARDFATHRRWAIRLFIVVSSVWFLRVGAILVFLLAKSVGDDPASIGDTVFTVMSYAAYVVPLAILELYLRARDRPGPRGRIAMASGLMTFTVIMGVGIVAATFAMWMPNIEAAYASRATLDEKLSATIRSQGIETAIAQYRALKGEKPQRYDFGKDQLNVLGYELLRAGKTNDAVRILQLNVETYPNSANAYDSLGEAYMDGGEKRAAIFNYQKSLALNSHNLNAIAKLQRLNTAPRR